MLSLAPESLRDSFLGQGLFLQLCADIAVPDMRLCSNQAYALEKEK